MAVVTACVEPEAPAEVAVVAPACPPVDGFVACASAVDCVASEYCALDDGAQCGVCTRIACISERDCRDQESCDLVRGRCERADACALFFPDAVDCSARGAPSGAVCAPVDELSQCALPAVSSCEVVPSVVIVSDGRAPIVEVLALDERGRPLPVAGALALPSILDQVARCQGPLPCRDVVIGTVTAADGFIISCEAPAIVLPDVPVDEARVIVRDMDTGVPIQNARVVMDSAGAVITDADGVAAFGAPLVRYARADANLYETVIAVAPGTNDVELLLPRTTASPGDAAGKLFTPDHSAMPGVGDIQIGLTTLSAPDLVDAFDRRALIGVTLDALVVLDGITDEGGQLTPQFSGSTMAVASSPIFGQGVAMGRPGAHLLSHLGSRMPMSALNELLDVVAAAAGDGDANDNGVADADTDGDGDIDDDDIRGPFDLPLTAAELGIVSLSFDLAGTVTTVERPLFEGLVTDFDDGSPPTVVRPALDASGELDVVMPALPARDDAAFVSLHAFVPGRGFVLLALRTVRDQNGDGLVDIPDDAAVQAGVVRMFAAPSMWTVERELLLVAGSQRFSEQRGGVLARNRVITRVDTALFGGDEVVRITVPPFRTDTPAIVEDGFVAVPDRADAFIAIHGEDGTTEAPFRVLVGGGAEETLVDLAELGVDVSALSSLRVWLMEGEPSFVAGTMDVARTLAAPRSARVVGP